MFNSIFTDIIALLMAIGAIAGLITYFFQRKVNNPSITASTQKTNKEIEQIEQEIESKYVLQVKKWVDDLEEIKIRHDKELESKNTKIEELHSQYLTALKASDEHKLRLTQFHKASRRLLVNINIPYWECGADGKLIYANGAWLKLFGLSSIDAVGEGWLTSIPENERKQLSVDWYSKVVDQTDGNIIFDVENALTHEKFTVKALYVIIFDENQDMNKIIGVTMRIDN